MNVVVNGLMTHYEKSGSGKTIVLLHGWADNSATFKDLIKELSDNYSVLVVDLPGFGKTQLPMDAWGLEQYADFVSAWLNKIGIGKVYAFLGHSNGGSIAIYGLGIGSLNADKLILLSSAGIRPAKPTRKLALTLVSKSGKMILAPLPEATKKKIRGKFYRQVGSDITVVPQLEETFKKIVRQDVQPCARQLNLPSLVIYGQADKQTPPAYGHIYNQLIPKSELKILPGVGHFPHHENPKKIYQLVREFLK